MLDQEAIEEFAKRLILHVRDAAVRDCDSLLRPTSKSPVAARWRAHAAGEVIGAVVPDIVDRTLAALLQAIDDGTLPLATVTDGKATVDLTSAGEGELTGWYMGSGGWRKEYSRERFNDDFAHLAQALPENDRKEPDSEG